MTIVIIVSEIALSCFRNFLFDLMPLYFPNLFIIFDLFNVSYDKGYFLILNKKPHVILIWALFV